VAEVGGTTRAPIHRYQFAPQGTELRGGEDLRNLGGARLGSVDAISFASATVDIKKRQDSAGIHPEAVFAHSYVDAKVMAESLLRIGTYVAQRGLRGVGSYQAARDLLLREIPRTGGQPLQREGETAVDACDAHALKRIVTRRRRGSRSGGGVGYSSGNPALRKAAAYRSRSLSRAYATWP
jgi:hypothetical protein